MLCRICFKNLRKNASEKSYQWKSDGKIKFLTFITVCKSFIFCEHFCSFFNVFEICIKFEIM
jgi:hypothetical protein